jgi:hypothetical protein
MLQNKEIHFRSLIATLITGDTEFFVMPTEEGDELDPESNYDDYDSEYD